MLRILSRLAWKRYLRRNALPFDDFNSFRQLSPPRQQAELARRLLKQIQYFGNRPDALPEWRDAAAMRNPQDLWKAWPSLPVVSKDLLRSRFPAQEISGRFGVEGRVLSTGGSTGEPTHFFHDTRMLLACVTSDIYTRIRMGWTPGLPTVVLWGSERDIGRDVPVRLRLMHQVLNEDLLDGYNLGAATIDRLRQSFAKHRQVAMYGFTSMLEFAARRFLESGIRVRPGQVKVAWNGGEMLFPQQVELFRKAFGATILNRYGGRELGAAACQYNESGALEVLRPWLFLEILNEAGRPAGPGEPGRIVCTSTVCQGSPFLRYEIGDSGVYEARYWNESGITGVSRIEGRLAGTLKLPDGRVISCLYWNHLLKDFAEIEQFQVVLKRDRHVGISLKGAGFAPHRELALRSSLDGFMAGIPYTITWLPDIPRTARGKLVQVISEGPDSERSPSAPGNPQP